MYGIISPALRSRLQPDTGVNWAGQNRKQDETQSAACADQQLEQGS